MATYIYELRGRGRPAVRHVLDEPDATLCDEYVDGEDNFVTKHGFVTQDCPVCIYLARHRLMERARSDVAQELGVDVSEVF